MCVFALRLAENKEYKEAVKFLKDKLHEVNILNAKLLFTNKLFKEFVKSISKSLDVDEEELKKIENEMLNKNTKINTTLNENYNSE